MERPILTQSKGIVNDPSTQETKLKLDCCQTCCFPAVFGTKATVHNFQARWSNLKLLEKGQLILGLLILLNDVATNILFIVEMKSSFSNPLIVRNKWPPYFVLQAIAGIFTSFGLWFAFVEFLLRGLPPQVNIDTPMRHVTLWRTFFETVPMGILLFIVKAWSRTPQTTLAFVKSLAISISFPFTILKSIWSRYKDPDRGCCWKFGCSFIFLVISAGFMVFIIISWAATISLACAGLEVKFDSSSFNSTSKYCHYQHSSYGHNITALSNSAFYFARGCPNSIDEMINSRLSTVGTVGIDVSEIRTVINVFQTFNNEYYCEDYTVDSFLFTIKMKVVRLHDWPHDQISAEFIGNPTVSKFTGIIKDCDKGIYQDDIHKQFSETISIQTNFTHEPFNFLDLHAFEFDIPLSTSSGEESLKARFRGTDECEQRICSKSRTIFTDSQCNNW